MKQENKNEFESLPINVEEAFISLCENWKCKFINDKASELIGKSKDELQNKTIWEAFPDGHGPVNEIIFRNAMTGRVSVCSEILNPLNNKWLDVRLTPHENGIDIFYTDISEEKYYKKNTAHNNERFAKAFDSSPVALTISRVQDESIVDVNASFLKLFEFNKDDIIGGTIGMLNIYPYDEHGTNTANLKLVKNAELNKQEVNLFTKSGKSLHLIYSTELITLNDDQYILSTFFDYTEKIKAQKIISESEVWFRSIADNSPVMIWGFDTNKSCNYVNTTWIEYTGRLAKNILGSDLTSVIHPEDLEGFKKTFNKAFEQRKSFQRQFRLKRMDGKYRWIFDYAKPILGPDGSFGGYIGSCADIHSKRNHYTRLEKLVKKRTLELTQLLENEKQVNEAKSRFVSMASHEFRTPLASIMSSVYLVEKYCERFDENHDPELVEKRNLQINRIIKSVNHLTDILNDFLSLDKLDLGKTATKYEEFDLKLYTNEIIEETKSLLKWKQILHHTYNGETLICQDKHILKSVYLNLLSNAIKYSEAEKQIWIDTQVSNKKVTVNVRDEGIGIPIEEQSNLFNRFFRAQNATHIEGTGLGLNIVKRYMQIIDGTINFTSNTENGTTFTVQFPRNIKV